MTPGAAHKGFRERRRGERRRRSLRDDSQLEHSPEECVLFAEPAVMLDNVIPEKVGTDHFEWLFCVWFDLLELRYFLMYSACAFLSFARHRLHNLLIGTFG
jgi:hypothetical protein